MEWKKVKVLLIFILALTNFFMVITLIQSYQNEHLVSKEIMISTPEILAKKGVIVSNGVLLRENGNFQSYKISSGHEAVEDFVRKARVGFRLQENTEELMMVIDHFQFSFEFSSSVPNFDEEKELTHYLTYMAGIKKNELRLIKKEKMGDQVSVNYQQYLNGIPLYGCHISLTLKEGKPLSAEGTLILKEEVTGNSLYDADPITALFLFAEFPRQHPEVHVVSIYPAYLPTEGTFGVSSLRSGFVLDTKEEGKFFIDISGKKVEKLS